MADLVDLDPSVNEELMSHTTAGRSIAIGLKSCYSFSQTIQGPSCNVHASRALSRCSAIWVSFLNSSSDELANVFRKPTGADFAVGLQIGAKRIPERLLTDTASCWYQTLKSLSLHKNALHTTSITPGGYKGDGVLEKPRFLIRLGTELNDEAAFTGVSLRNEMVTLEAKGIAGVDTAVLVLEHDIICEITASGCTILD